MPPKKVDEQIRTRAARRHAHAIHMRPPLSSDTRVGCLTNLASFVSPGVSAKERPSRAWGEEEGGEVRSVVCYEGLELWEARSVVFYKGLRLWEAHLYVIYVSGRLSGGTMSNGHKRCCEPGLVR